MDVQKRTRSSRQANRRVRAVQGCRWNQLRGQHVPRWAQAPRARLVWSRPILYTGSCSGSQPLVMPHKKKNSARRPSARYQLARARRDMEELNRIGVALSATRDVNALLELILTKSREITGADAGSLYLVEQAHPSDSESGPGNRHLRFKLTQNASVQFPFTESTLPITGSSLAGYVALHGEVIQLADVYAIPHGRRYHFNPKFDQESGYRTRSLLALPMKNGKGEVLGVLQLINCKRNPKARLSTPAAVRKQVCPFPSHAVGLALS